MKRHGMTWVSVLAGLLTIAGFVLFVRFPSPLWSPLIVLLLLALLTGGYLLLVPPKRLKVYWHSYALILSSSLASIGLLSVLEGVWIIYMIIAVQAAIATALFSVAGEQYAGALLYSEKPIRRMLMVVIAYSAYALFTVLFALQLFFPNTPPIFFLLTTAIVGGVAAYLIWYLYQPGSWRDYLLWIIVLGLMVFELRWVLQRLPFGYTVLGFALAWCWYTAQLLIRFHIAPTGILWHKQRRYFIVSALVLIAIFAYYVRWI